MSDDDLTLGAVQGAAAELFSLDHRELLEQGEALAAAAQPEHRRKRRVDLAWRIPAATGAAVAGVAGAAALNPFLGVGGVVVARRILEGAVRASALDREQVRRRAALEARLAAEAGERRRELESGATRPRAALSRARARRS